MPNLHDATLLEFQGRSRLPQWMRDATAAVRPFVAQVPQPARPADIGGSVGAQVSPGEAPAYRLWASMLQSHQAYHSRYKAQKQSAHARDTVDKWKWEEGLEQGGAEFVYRGVKFTTQEGVPKWVGNNGNHIMEGLGQLPVGTLAESRESTRPPATQGGQPQTCPRQALLVPTLPLLRLAQLLALASYRAFWPNAWWSA